MGADVIMPVAGPQTIDTVQEIKNQGSKCIVIGVDTPQEYSTTVNDNSVYTDKELNANNAGFSLDFLYHHPNNKIIKFSAIKQMARMVDIIG
jgi:basic membrane lipoprotein Med (substrate-binding protein (PBP1-ABC) superfamily)